MTGPELAAIRKRLGLGTVAMGRALGYGGNDNTISVAIRKYESAGREIPPWIARLAHMYGRFGVPDDLP